VGRFPGRGTGRIGADARGHIGELNGDAAPVAAVGNEAVGVLAPEFGPLGMAHVREVTDPARLVLRGGQWRAEGPDRP
jgi:hypothetical protein